MRKKCKTFGTLLQIHYICFLASLPFSVERWNLFLIKTNKDKQPDKQAHFHVLETFFLLSQKFLLCHPGNFKNFSTTLYEREGDMHFGPRLDNN